LQPEGIEVRFFTVHEHDLPKVRFSLPQVSYVRYVQYLTLPLLWVYCFSCLARRRFEQLLVVRLYRQTGTYIKSTAVGKATTTTIYIQFILIDIDN